MLYLIIYSNYAYSQTYTLGVNESVTVSQTAMSGGYIDNVGLGAFIDPHLSFSINYDGSAKITVNSYFDYTATVQLVFIERYQSYYSGRYHTRAATYHKSVNIKCKYVAPQPNIKPTKVRLPERVRVPLDTRVDIYPTYEPYGAKGTKFEWYQSQGTAVFSHMEYSDGGYRVTGRSTGLGSLSVKVDNDDNLYASTIIEVVDPNNLPPDNIFLPSNIQISVGGHATLEPILVPEGTSTSYTWSSDNTGIATVSYGKVVGVKVGTTTITVKTANKLVSTCKVTVVNANGKDDEDDDNNQTSGTVDGYDYVDLGLSVKWAACNVGAKSPEDFGSYFAWGETSAKSSYSWTNYSYGSSALDCRYIGSDISGTSYDAAYSVWGKNWRMPNEKEMGELISKCQITSSTQNGVSGYLVTGPNGNSLFLPTADTKFYNSVTGCIYWTSTVDDYEGISLLITSRNGQPSATLRGQVRSMGIPIRAVTDASSTSPKIKLTLSANPPSGSAKSGDKVYLTAKADGSTVSGADIYYTTNGTTPTKSSTKYASTGITINNACTLKAIAYKDGYEASSVLTTSYTIKNSSSSSDIIIDATNFPDKNFRDYLLSQSYGKDGVLTADEIEKITRMFVHKMNITNLKGIEFFTALEQLRCYSNQLTTLDVSKNTALTELDCSTNPLNALDVSKNTALETLSCRGNQLTALDVSKNTALKVLECGNNQLTTLDVSKNTALTWLSCNDNRLTTLDVSQNTALTELNCSKNRIKKAEMEKLVNSLPRVNDEKGKFYVIDKSYGGYEGNVCTKAQVANAKAKGWAVRYWDVVTRQYIDYEGSEDTSTKEFVLVPSAGYATFFDSESAYTLPNGLSAQVVTRAANGKLTYKTIADGSVNGVVPKGTAVMLQSDTQQAEIFTLTESESTTTYMGTNLLRGTDNATTTTGDGYHYKLSYGPSGSNWSDVFGWYWGMQNGSPFQIEGHRAWLVVPKGNSTRVAAFPLDEMLMFGVDENVTITHQTEHEDMFDLQGRQVERPTKKGIYISNGRKVIVK